MPRAAPLAAVLLVVASCGSADELDLGDLSDRTVPTEDAAPEQTRSAETASGTPPAGGLARDELGGFVDTCDVLTDEAVAATTGLDVLGHEETPGFGCTWFVANVDPDVAADDAIVFQPFPAGQFDAQLQAVEQGLDGEEIAGLGEAAVYIGSEARGEVWVRIEALSFRVVNQFAFTNVDGRPIQEALAAELVAALG